MFLPEHVRAYIYSLLTPVNALLVFYGVLSDESAALWLGLAGAVLQTGAGALAAANTSTRKKGTDGSHTGN